MSPLPKTTAEGKLDSGCYRRLAGTGSIGFGGGYGKLGWAWKPHRPFIARKQEKETEPRKTWADFMSEEEATEEKRSDLEDKRNVHSKAQCSLKNLSAKRDYEMTKRLPPFGKQYLEQKPSAGLWVAIGPGAWDFAKSKNFPVLVLPDDAEPSDFEWPTDGRPVLVHERGTYDDNRLRAMAEALLRAGACSVVAIRDALLDDYDPRKFFDAEVIDVAA